MKDSRQEPGSPADAVQNRRSRKVLGFKIVAILMGLLFSTVVGEIVVRLMGLNDDYRSPVVNSVIPSRNGPTGLLETGFVPYATIRTTYPSNPRGYFDHLDSIEHHFNSEGWREDEVSAAKPSQTFRIFALGDSYLFGQGVKREDLFIKKLEDLLNREGAQRQVQTINSGQPGYNTWDGITTARKNEGSILLLISSC